MKRTVVLIILDGWGLGKSDESNPIYKVKPATLASIEARFPMTSLQASGISVGLPWGEVGNSEVGHLTIGAGKVLYQYYPRITLAIRDGSFSKNEVLEGAMRHAKQHHSALNLVGLLSKGNVHSSLEHLTALIDLAKKEGVKVKLHLFGDGKDMPPKTIPNLLDQLEKEDLATLVGRYYAMDREENWQLVRQTYECLTGGGGQKIEDIETFFKEFFAKNGSEEFIPPARFGGDEKNISENEAVLFFNFREDSMREITAAFVDPVFQAFPVKKFQNLFVGTMSAYSDKFKVPVAFPPEKINKCLGKVISDAGKSQLRLAETYKYAHITYFFNGYIEAPFPNEYRVVIPSEPIPHPDEHPEMMAPAITERLLAAIHERSFDFVLVNYANPDAIAHTGNYDAAMKAVGIIDEELGKVVKASLENDAIVLITSDHGNVEELVNPISGRRETQHDPNPVPLYLIHPSFEGKRFLNAGNLNETLGILSDIAPTVLELMGLEKPEEMTGQSLLSKLY